MKGLIIKPYWADLILNGNKTMELRSSKTNIRGKIGIIKNGSKQVYGTVELIDCVKLDSDLYYKNKKRHCVEETYDKIPYKNLYGWILKYPIKFNKPIPYNHKQGCIIWVNLEGDEFNDIL